VVACPTPLAPLLIFSAQAWPANLSSEVDVKSVMDAFIEAGGTFTLKNAAPDRFILVPHPQLVATDIKFDPSRYDQMGKIYKALLRVDQQLVIYESYKSKNLPLWEKYFRIYTQKISDARADLLLKYISCGDRGECNAQIPTKIDGITLDDIAYGGEITASCPLGYQQASNLNATTGRQTEYISSIVLAWSGYIRYLDDIDINGLEIYRISPDLEMIKLPFNAGRQLRTRDQTDGTTAAFIMLHRESVDPGAAKKESDIDLNYLDGIRSNAARSVYLLRFRTTAGVSVDDVLGYPNMKGCKLIDEHL